MKKRILFGAAIAAALFASPVYAGGLWPTLPSTNGPLTGSEYVPADTGYANGAYPQTEAIPVQVIRASTYQQVTPLTGNTVAANSPTTLLDLTPAGTLAALTVTFPAAPVDGQSFKIFTTQILTALTLQAASGSGQTINGAVTTLGTANTGVEYFYDASAATWYRKG